jgi:hypothetical protein
MNGSLTINVWVTPHHEGKISGIVIFADDRSPNPWRDTVTVTGFGAKPGVQIEFPDLNFGDARVGGRLTSDFVRIFNSGAIADTIDTIVSADPAHFDFAQGSPVGRTILPPGGDIVFRCVFKPSAEGVISSTITVLNRSNTRPTMSVSGRGVLEHVNVSPAALDFGCVKSGRDSMMTVTLTNTGTYPLTITGAGVTLGSDVFELLDYTGVTTIPPGGSGTYRVRYTALRGKANGEIRIATTADEPVVITIAGDICAEITGFELRAPSASGRVGSPVVIPISVRVDRPVTEPVPYQLTLTYQYDLLTPLDPSRRDARPPVVNGTLSGEASMQRGTYLGEVLVVGTMKPVTDTDWHTLVGIPMKVLLGSTFEGELGLKDVKLTLTGAKVSTGSGTFYALPCDTAGGVVISSGKYSLGQNYPNPGTPSATIHYEIASRERVTLNLYDANGDVVKTLLDEVEDAGGHDYRLDTSGLAAGVYTYELISGRFRMTKRMVIVE